MGQKTQKTSALLGLWLTVPTQVCLACSWHIIDTQYRLLESTNDDVKFETNRQRLIKVDEQLGKV